MSLMMLGAVGGGRVVPGGGGGDLYPNKPAGMTEILAIDGTVAITGSDAFGIADFSTWFFNGAEDSSRITVVADSDNPLGNNSALNFHWEAMEGEAGAGLASASDLGDSETGYDKIYFAFRFKKVAATDAWEFGHKIFYFGLLGGGATGLYFDLPGSDGISSSLRIINQSGSGDVVLADTVSSVITIGDLTTVEAILDQGTGEVKLWVNETLEVDATRTLPSTAFSGVQWYAMTGSEFTVDSDMRLYELYQAGVAA